MISSIRRFLRISTFSFKALFGWLNPKIYVAVKVIDPIIQVIFYALLVKYIHGGDDITPWVVGSAIIQCTKNTVFGVGTTMRNERISGTLKQVIATPSSKFEVFFARSFLHIFDAIITVLIGFTVGYLFFGLSIPSESITLVAVAITICIFSACSFGLVISNIGLVSTDMNFLLNFISIILLAFSGALFPIEELHYVLRQIALFLPITRSLEAIRLIISNGDIQRINSLMIQEILVGCLFLFAGYITFRFVERIAKKEATIDLY